MNTATVRDLRSRYSALLEWIEAGEEIVITQRGKAIARLIPESAVKSAVADWSESPAVKRDRTSARVLTAEASAGIIRDAGGIW